jgi:hypothetical protein
VSGGLPAAGCAGPKAEKREKILFFFFSQHFKAFSKYILNSLLNLIQTTQYKNLNAAA